MPFLTLTRRSNHSKFHLGKIMSTWMTRTLWGQSQVSISNSPYSFIVKPA